MSITNQAKPTTSLVNPTKVVGYESWDSNTSTWDTETRTWNEMGTIFSNTSKVMPQMTAYLKLDESSGSVVDSVSGEIYTDTNSNVTRTTGKISNCAVFSDTTGTKLASNNSLNLFSPTQLSLSFWIYPTASTGLRYVINDNLSNVSILVQSLRIIFRRYTSSGTFSLSSTVGITPINTWTHVICTYDSIAGSKIYINNVLNVSDTVNIGINNAVPAQMIVGTQTLAGTAGFTGRLDEIGFWNTTLSQDAVTYLYNSGNGVQPPFTLKYSNIINQLKP